MDQTVIFYSLFYPRISPKTVCRIYLHVPARSHFCSVGPEDDISSIEAITAVLSVCPEIVSCQLAVVCVMPCKEVRKQLVIVLCDSTLRISLSGELVATQH